MDKLIVIGETEIIQMSLFGTMSVHTELVSTGRNDSQNRLHFWYDYNNLVLLLSLSLLEQQVPQPWQELLVVY